MTENDAIPSKYYCFICNKKYSTYKTLWSHKKIFHNNNKIIVDNVNGGVNSGVNSGVNVVNENIKNNHNCLFCNKAFNSRQSKYQHKKYCKFRKEEEKEKEENIKLINNNNQINNGTINNTTNNISNNQTINNQTINNQTINITNNIIYNFNSKEEKIMIKDIIDENDKNKLYNKEIQDKIIELVELIYTKDKYNCFQNVLLKNKSKYNNDIHILENNKLIVENKDKILERLIYNYMTYTKKIDNELNLKKNKDNTITEKYYEKCFLIFKKDKDKLNKNKYFSELNKNKNRISQILYNNNKLISNNIKSYINNTEKIKNENVKLIENIKNENVKLTDEKKEIIICDDDKNKNENVKLIENIKNENVKLTDEKKEIIICDDDKNKNEYDDTIDIIDFDKSQRNNFINLIVETIDENLYFDIFNQHFESWIIQLGKFIFRGKHNKFKNVFIQDGKGYLLMGNKFIEDKIKYLLEEIIFIIIEVIELLNKKYNVSGVNKDLIENDFKKMTDLYDEDEYVRFYYDVHGIKHKTFKIFVKTKLQEIIQK
jgi:hypothetical protein